MTEESSNTKSVTTTQESLTSSTDPILSSLVIINAAQLLLKLEPTTYPSGKAQLHALLFGYGLLGFIDGTKRCPLKEVLKDAKPIPNIDCIIWERQDKLLLHAIISSLDKQVASLVSSSQTSFEAWTRLAQLYANPSSSRIVGLKEQLTVITCGSQPVDDYLRTIRTLADEIALVGSPPQNDDLVIYTHNGIGSEFREIVAAVRARDHTITFEELRDKLTEYEAFLKREEKRTTSATILANATRFSSVSHHKSGI